MVTLKLLVIVSALFVVAASESCGYEDVTVTSPLVAGREQEVVGSVSVTVSNAGVQVSYELSKEGCSLTDTAHVEVTDAPLPRLAPGRFDCHKTPPSGATMLDVTCTLGEQDCCSDIIVYTHAVIDCGAGGEDTVFAGPPDNQCEGARWCRYFSVSPTTSPLLFYRQQRIISSTNPI